jgi:hypothetical protein
MNAKKNSKHNMSAFVRPFLRYVSHATPLLGLQPAMGVVSLLYIKKKVHNINALKVWSCTQNEAWLLCTRHVSGNYEKYFIWSVALIIP